MMLLTSVGFENGLNLIAVAAPLPIAPCSAGLVAWDTRPAGCGSETAGFAANDCWFVAVLSLFAIVLFTIVVTSASFSDTPPAAPPATFRLWLNVWLKRIVLFAMTPLDDRPRWPMPPPSAIEKLPQM